MLPGRGAKAPGCFCRPAPSVCKLDMCVPAAQHERDMIFITRTPPSQPTHEVRKKSNSASSVDRPRGCPMRRRKICRARVVKRRGHHVEEEGPAANEGLAKGARWRRRSPIRRAGSRRWAFLQRTVIKESARRRSSGIVWETLTDIYLLVLEKRVPPSFTLNLKSPGCRVGKDGCYRGLFEFQFNAAAPSTAESFDSILPRLLVRRLDSAQPTNNSTTAQAASFANCRSINTTHVVYFSKGRRWLLFLADCLFRFHAGS
ncbi:hypothetical protein F4819DRAFT_241418 [Hypoxylon fuscum]|nr:hypothetical protein F4819DRAFT_241418 [Hypoxylon fuscum]